MPLVTKIGMVVLAIVFIGLCIFMYIKSYRCRECGSRMVQFTEHTGSVPEQPGVRPPFTTIVVHCARCNYDEVVERVLA